MGLSDFFQILLKTTTQDIERAWVLYQKKNWSLLSMVRLRMWKCFHRARAAHVFANRDNNVQNKPNDDSVYLSLTINCFQWHGMALDCLQPTKWSLHCANLPIQSHTAQHSFIHSFNFCFILFSRSTYGRLRLHTHTRTSVKITPSIYIAHKHIHERTYARARTLFLFHIVIDKFRIFNTKNVLDVTLHWRCVHNELLCWRGCGHILYIFLIRTKVDFIWFSFSMAWNCVHVFGLLRA